MSGNFTVLSPEQEERLRKLETFYATIRNLTNSANLNKIAYVYAALTAVDPNWNIVFADAEGRN
jgi:hypothetical protein